MHGGRVFRQRRRCTGIAQSRRARSIRARVRVNEQASELLLALAFVVRGVLIKMCQAIATRSARFPPSFIERLKQALDSVPPRDFQADPHPGNLMVTPEGKIIVLDFGLSKSDFVLVGRVFALPSGIAHTLGHRANILAAMGATAPG